MPAERRDRRALPQAGHGKRGSSVPRAPKGATERAQVARPPTAPAPHARAAAHAGRRRCVCPCTAAVPAAKVRRLAEHLAAQSCRRRPLPVDWHKSWNAVFHPTDQQARGPLPRAPAWSGRRRATPWPGEGSRNPASTFIVRSDEFTAVTSVLLRQTLPGSPAARKLRNARFGRARSFANVPVCVKCSSAPSVETNAPACGGKDHNRGVWRSTIFCPGFTPHVESPSPGGAGGCSQGRAFRLIAPKKTAYYRMGACNPAAKRAPPPRCREREMSDSADIAYSSDAKALGLADEAMAKAYLITTSRPRAPCLLLPVDTSTK